MLLTWHHLMRAGREMLLLLLLLSRLLLEAPPLQLGAPVDAAGGAPGSSTAQLLL
jgi:hypothetical protein